MAIQKDDSEPVTTEEYRLYTINTHPINNLRIISSIRSVNANIDGSNSYQENFGHA